IARGGTGGNGISTGLGRVLTAGEQAGLAGCTISGGLISGGCGATITDTLVFSLTSATITLASPLPLIADSAPTTVNGLLGLSIVRIDASGIGPGNNGLRIFSDNNTVEYLSIEHSPHDDFYVDGGNNLMYVVGALGAGSDG